MRGSPTRGDLALVAAGALGLVLFLLFYGRAIPRAGVELEVTRDDAVDTAADVLADRGAALDGYERAARFGGDDIELAFLQRTLGLDEASRWAREEVALWSWRLRWFRPDEKEEWRVRIGVGGELVAFEHRVDEAAAGADLDGDSARALAEAFLAERGWATDTLERAESTSRARDNRTDHHFEWVRPGTTLEWGEGDADAGTAAVRVAVDVQGEEIGGYRHYLDVPERFRRDHVRTQSVGGLFALGALGLTFVLVLVALGIAIARHREDDVAWRAALGPALVVAGLVGVGGLSGWPSARYAYPTEIAWGAYLGFFVVGILFAGVLYGLWVLFTTAAGESLTRETFPDTLSGFLDAARGRLLGRPMAEAGFRGYAVGFLLLGYLATFYVVARELFGAWVPAEGPHSEVFNSYLPFLAPLTVSLVAAVSEELMYRLFGISLLKRYLKSTFLALLIPAAIWAFGHASYPVFPVWVRGVELTIAGLVFGVVFLKLGILTCIVAHYVVDAVILGTPLLTSGDPRHVTSGVLVMALALVPAALGLGARRTSPERADGNGRGAGPPTTPGARELPPTGG